MKNNLKKLLFSVLVIFLISGIFVAGCTTAESADFTGDQRTETKTIVDQLGREVQVPVDVDRVVSLHHHTVDIIVELDGGEKLVGVLKNWKGRLGPGFEELYPSIDSVPAPGDLTSVNIEELLALDPDVVFVAHQMPQNVIDQIEDAGIPVVGIALYEAEYEEASKLNPDLTNPDKAYEEGLKNAITIIGETIGKEQEAKELIDYTYNNRDFVRERTASVSHSDRVKVYIANPDLNTYGTGKYTGVMIDRAGGINVAEKIKGYQQVTMEQILSWNPDVIIVQDRYAAEVDKIKSDPAWAEINAVKNNKVIITPEYAKPWGHPTPESMAIGELWMAKVLYPDKFSDVDIDSMANEFYMKFYGVPYTP